MADQSEAAGSLSIGAAEFQRLQTQLIDLRTTNYQLKEQQARLNAEISQLQETVRSQTRDLERANKTIQRSKKAKELQALIEEHDGLQRKMENQEEDFRLQNKTLMEELSRVCDENELLKLEVSKFKSSPAKGGEGGGVEGEEVTHLRAGNAALQKSLQALQEKLEELTNTSREGEEQEYNWSSSNAKVVELEVRLATEEEEKRLLRRQLEEIQESARREQAQLRSELEKWTDKAKKKQDSLLTLQEEKEKYFLESRAAFNEMVRSKDHEIQLLQSQIDSLKSDAAARHEAVVTNEEIAKQLETLSREKEEMSLKCSILIKDKESLVKERDETKGVLDELGQELQQAKVDLGEERKQSTDLWTQLEEAKLSQEQLADQVVSTNEEKYNLIKDLEASRKLAEKRKLLLDELSIKGQESVTEHIRKADEIQEKCRGELSQLQRELEEERTRSRRMAETNEEVPELRRKLRILEEDQQEHQARISQMEEALSQEREKRESSLVQVWSEHEDQTKTLRAELEAARSEVEGEREKVRELEQQMEDRKEEVKIVERKSNNMLKDLKRQLQHMQKREERLQEQVNELKGGQALEQLFGSPVPPSREQNDSLNSRESSLSSLRGILTDGPPSGAIGSPATPSGGGYTGGVQSTPQPQGVSEETRELLARVAELQQEKWLLEERVNHLETNGSALAEDILQKSEIIKTYFMESKLDHTPSKRSVMDKMSPMRLLAKSKEETLSEINRKMQRALEEALMKNIHLQENIDMLTTELEKYTKAEAAREESAVRLGGTSEPSPEASKES